MFSDRAREVAEALLGTAGNLRDLATEQERNDRTFLFELDAQVRECECCGWWVETDELNGDDQCQECAEGS